MLVAIEEGHYEARCVGCMRVSPSVRGPAAEVRTTLTELGWVFDAREEAHCAVCLQRATSRRARFGT